MNIRKAAPDDIEDVAEIYEDIHTQEEAGLASIGWVRGVYPTASTAQAALDRGDLFVMANSGEWFTGRGRAESLGHVLLEENRALMDILRPAFASWYSLGHVDESDSDTILLKVTLTDGVLMKHGKRYEMV